MKKRYIACLGVGLLLLSACSSAYSIDDAKNAYKDKSYDGYVIANYEHNPEAELVKDKQKDQVASYIATYIVEIKSHTVNKFDSADTLNASEVNFNARVDLESEWAKNEYNDEFTYELSDGAVNVSFSASKTVTSDEDKSAGYSVAYAFSYIAGYNKEGLLESSRLTIAIVKTDENKGKDVTKYRVTSTMSATWKQA